MTAMTDKKRGLGRGLEALLGQGAARPAAAMAAQPRDQLTHVPVDLLEKGKYQPRQDMREESLAELAVEMVAFYAMPFQKEQLLRLSNEAPVGPDYVRPSYQLPQAFPEAGSAAGATLRTDWWTLYGDAKLLKWFTSAWKKTGKKLDMGKCCIRFKRLDEVPLDVLAAVCWQESRLSLAPRYASLCGVRIGHRYVRDDGQSATIAARTLARAHARCGTWLRAVAAYRADGRCGAPAGRLRRAMR